MLDNKDHTFVIAEAGSNWKAGTYEEDLARARKLIEVASDAGADAVKFQTFRTETVYVPNAGVVDYLGEKGIKQSINEIFENLSMPYEMIPELARFCKDKKIMFMSTPFSVEDVRQIDPYVEIHKVASYEINHIRLVEEICKTKKPIIISTGASTPDEISFVVDLVEKNGGGPFALMQCTSKYPCPISALNLSVIPNLKESYHVPVGLSDHSIEPDIAPLVAVGLGASVVEKHFTLDKNLEGPDHGFALNPEELRLMIRAIREADSAKGPGKKIILKEEEELRRFATRAIQATKDITKGEVLVEGQNFDILRPGNQPRGAEPRFTSLISHRHAKRDIKRGSGITLSDCE
ncbi:MAG: N-acetylneuraminate synthase family protein [Nitrosarchaeum sp.]|nr:N-acetylneuraminate synthase family protein [Nitrosarchaeum sp.]MCA9819706.1 N-acetylneuraminate synthase family protein [Nitrosarchaeum sp.]